MTRNKAVNYYKKIAENYLEINYLTVLEMAKDKKIALRIMQNIVEKIFSYDLYINNLLTIHEVIRRYIIMELRKYVSVHQLRIKDDNTTKNDLDYTIPEVLYLFTFDFYEIFNNVDCEIIVGIIIQRRSLSTLSKTLNLSENYISERFHDILFSAKNVYINSIKMKILDEIK